MKKGLMLGFAMAAWACGSSRTFDDDASVGGNRDSGMAVRPDGNAPADGAAADTGDDGRPASEDGGPTAQDAGMCGYSKQPCCNGTCVGKLTCQNNLCI
jgi:hypothetical protein